MQRNGCKHTATQCNSILTTNLKGRVNVNAAFDLLSDQLNNIRVNAKMFAEQSELHPAYRDQFLMIADATKAALEMMAQAEAAAAKVEHERHDTNR